MNGRSDRASGDRGRRMEAVGLVAIVIAATAGCGGAGESSGTGVAETSRITRLDTLVSVESQLLATPYDMAVSEGGDLYIVDAQDSRILRVSGGSSRSSGFIGSKGAGPGELDLPVAIAVAGDTLRVVEQGNGRVQVLDTDGNYQRSFPLRAANLGGFDIAGDGRLAAATMGFQADSLVVLFDPDGEPIDSLGEPVTQAHDIWDMAAIQNQIAAGQVPGALRNWASAALDPGGGVWLVLVAEGEVRRYDAEGNLLWSRPLDTAELAAIKQDFFERNAKLRGQMSFAPLSYVSDVEVAAGDLWLLLDMPEDMAAVVLVLDGGGTIRRRILFPDVMGARQIAVDPRHGRLFLAIPAAATVLSATLP